MHIPPSLIPFAANATARAIGQGAAVLSDTFRDLLSTANEMLTPQPPPGDPKMGLTAAGRATQQRVTAAQIDQLLKDISAKIELALQERGWPEDRMQLLMTDGDLQVSDAAGRESAQLAMVLSQNRELMQLFQRLQQQLPHDSLSIAVELGEAKIQLP